MAVFGVLGGDRRQLYLARSLEEDGHTLFLHGLEGLEGAAAFPTLPLEELGRRCPVVVLPLPAVREGSFLNAPFARAPIPLDDSFAAALAHCLVLGGMVGKLRQTSPLWETIPLEDYYQREELTVGKRLPHRGGRPGPGRGARPWGPGGLSVFGGGLWAHWQGAVLGFARPGRPGGLRRPQAPGFGRHPGHGLRGPHLWPGERPLRCDFQHRARPCHRGEILACQGPDTLLLELASAPGGICRGAAQARGLRLLDCPSLPGRFSPKASGELVKEAVYHILEERRKLS